jgi:hypothetical protein
MDTAAAAPTVIAPIATVIIKPAPLSPMTVSL